jgi:hypothetical protein
VESATAGGLIPVDVIPSLVVSSVDVKINSTLLQTALDADFALYFAENEV